MRWTHSFVALAALSGLGLVAPDAARATDLFHDRTASSGDRYAYKYEPNGYYPFYNSAYWRPASELKGRHHYHFKAPKYYPYWGGPKKEWDNRAWHEAHDGPIRPWQW